MRSAVQTSSTSQWRHLRGEIWLAYCLHVTSANPYRFSVEYLADEEAGSKLIYKWLNQRSWPTLRTARKVAGKDPDIIPDKTLPEALWLFEALELFRNRSLSRPMISRLLAERLVQSASGAWQWAFPGTVQPITQVTSREDIVPLEARADFWGFLGIVALVREAEARQDGRVHAQRCSAMYRALPTAIDTPWVKSTAPRLKESIEALRTRMMLSAVMLNDEGQPTF